MNGWCASACVRMADWLALADVAILPRPGRVVAASASGGLDHVEFRVRIAGWKEAFANRPGTRWALHFDDATDFAAALFGAWHAGKMPILCPDALPETLARLRAQVDGFAGNFPVACKPLLSQEAGLGSGDDGAAWPALDEQATRLCLHTSGSSGDAVLIEKRLSQLAREVESLQAAFGERIADAVVVHGTVSHQHIYGLLFRVLWPLCAGRIFMPRLFFHEEILAALDAPAILVSSPAHLRRLPATLDWTPAHAHLRAVFSSGGALPTDAAVAVRDRMGCTPLEIYGSSETGGIAWNARDSEFPNWLALPGVAWRLIEGQLEVASSHLPPGMGWWRCADRAEAAGTGFRLLGRADRIVKVEERRVSLTALERDLETLDEVARARVLTLEGPRTELVAVIVPSATGNELLARAGKRAFVQRLVQCLSASHDAVMRPRRWRLLAALPMNAQGKTTEAALRTLFRPARPEPAWLERGEDSALVELVLSPDLLVFDGHFPGVPILPGVAQVDWAIRLAREAFSVSADVLRMEALKFQRVARPGLRLRLHLQWLAAGATLSFRYESELGPHANGRVLFAGASA